jgi:hypothetical protein
MVKFVTRCLTSQTNLVVRAIVKADKRLILAITQTMWDLWWTKWHWTAFSTSVSVLRRQLLFHLLFIFIYLSIEGCKVAIFDDPFPGDTVTISQKRINKNVVSYIVEIKR